MMRTLKILFKLAIFFGVIGIFFTLVMLAAKIWGIYCMPPSEKVPSGATYVLTRNDDEPFLNAPDRPMPPPPPEEPRGPSMFGSGPIKRRPVNQRIILKFPYIKWLHNQAKDSTSTLYRMN